MASTDMLSRTMHDVGLAAWFGGSLMGAVGLNGASSEISNPRERSQVASDGWSRWVPWQAAAIGAHLVGGAGVLISNRNRAKNQSGVRLNTIIKLGVTGAALGITAYSRVLGKKIEQAGSVPTGGATTPTSETPQEVTAAQQQLQALQWAIPAITGAMLVLSAQQGEMQRPGNVASGLASTATKSLSRKLQSVA